MTSDDRKRARAVCDKKSPGQWWISEDDGSIRCDAGHVSDNDFDDGDEEFVITASMALPEALDEIERLRKALQDARHEVSLAYSRIDNDHESKAMKALGALYRSIDAALGES